MIRRQGHIGMNQEDDTPKAPERICAWCNKVMQEGTRPATHGMCPECLKKQMQRLGLQKKFDG